MDGSTTMHIWAQITEFRESVTTSKRKINVVVGGNVEGDMGETGWEMGIDMTIFHCISFSPLTKHPMKQYDFVMKENTACEAQSPFAFLMVYRNCCLWECKG